MKWPIVLCLLSCACITLGAPLSLCPKSCSCTTTSDNNLEVQCKSTQFLESALSPQQAATITSLSLNNCGITKIEWNMTQFENLKVLSLKSNKLKFINVANLPTSLSYLDLSHNLIKILPEDLTSLIHLKKINIFGNPISCTCKSLGVRDHILRKISFEAIVKCDSPKSLHGRSFLSIHCKKDDIEKLFSGMQGDAPYEGSGFEEEEIATNDENIENNDHLETEPDIEDEFMLMGKSTTTAKALEKHEELTTTSLPIQPTEIEGSGISDDEFKDNDNIGELINENSTIPNLLNEYDEDDEADKQAYSELSEELSEATEEPIDAVNMSLPSACNFNCSTPAPLENSNETEVSPAPGLFEAAKMFFNDLDIFDDKSETTTVTTTTTTTAADIVISVVKSTEPSFNNDTEPVAGVNETNEIKGKIKSGDVNESSSTYIFLFILLALVVSLIVFAIFKRRSIQRKRDDKKRKLEEIEGPAEEMKLLKKPVIEVNNKPNGTNETVALINGNTDNQQNGVEPTDINLTNGKKLDDEDVEIRRKIADDTKLLTPEAKRVTVKASEIPNSTPKTPILVTRHLNSDGSIVTTPNSDQQMQ